MRKNIVKEFGKKILSYLMLFVLCMSFGINVYAATNSSGVGATWYVGASGNGYVSGATNKKFHTLNAGTVQLKVSCTNVSSKEPAYAKLYMQKTGFDSYFGRVNIDTTKTKTYTFPQKTKKKSSRYYLEFGGGKDMLYHTVDGTVFNK